MKLFIWGTGRLAGKVVGKYISLENIEGFIDNNASGEYMGKKVYRPQEVVHKQYDAICVANLYSEEICRQCREIGLDLDRVLFLYANCRLQDRNKDYAFAEKILGKEYAAIVKNRYHVVRGVEAYGDLCLEGSGMGGYIDTDYVRMKCFELAVKEIRKKGVRGSVAEVGVFRGEFAQYINAAFPDRTCYLFDSFEGFDAAEALKEKKDGNCTEAFEEAYKNTNIHMVLERMKHLDKVVIKQGYFPESLDGLEDTFAFVSLDVDFEESIYEGMKYFYPRLAEGGYLFVHDYNSSLRGVEKAVDRFEKELGRGMCKMPLCDANGTLVVMRSGS